MPNNQDEHGGRFYRKYFRPTEENAEDIKFWDAPTIVMGCIFIGLVLSLLWSNFGSNV